MSMIGADSGAHQSCHGSVAYYQRLRERGMTGSVAVGHLASKLISVMFFCVRRGEPYDPQRHLHDLGLDDA